MSFQALDFYQKAGFELEFTRSGYKALRFIICESPCKEQASTQLEPECRIEELKASTHEAWGCCDSYLKESVAIP